tara:strand:+ start:4976 stop:5530 length:555 start_codon:yes stop_codon:yes gene_type:complete
MSRIPTIESANAPQPVTALYEAVQQKLGLVPNMVKALGNSAASLQGYLGLSGAVSSGILRPVTREKIALRVAELNECDYCLSAHTAIGGLLKIPADELVAARAGDSADAKEQAILNLVQSVLETRGNVPDAAYESAQDAGVSPEEATEVVAHVALNVFTNYFNRFAQTEIDFPKVESGLAAAAA